jgi:inosose dehydratase
MKKLNDELGIQSYCFRGFGSNDEVITHLTDSGVTTTELCGVHVDFSAESTFAGVIDTYKQSGIRIVSIGVETLKDEEATERKRFEFVKLAGARHLSVDFKPDTSPASWKTAERLAEEYDVYLGIHNHGGRHWLGSTEFLDHVFANTGNRIGLCLDTAWALDSREDPIKMAERYSDRLYGVHIKDFAFDRARNPEDVIVGQGNLDLPGLLKLIESNENVKMTVLEYEGDVEDPVPALKECVDAVRALN